MLIFGHRSAAVTTIYDNEVMPSVIFLGIFNNVHMVDIL